MKKAFYFLVFISILIYSITARAQDGDIVWTKWTHNIARLQFSNDDSKILTVGSGGIIIFDTQTGEQLKQLPGYLDGEYSSDNSLIIGIRETPDSINQVFPCVDVIDANNYEVLRTITLPKLPSNPGFSRLALSPGSQILAVVNLRGLYLIDFITGEIEKQLTQFDNNTKTINVVYFVFSKIGNQLIFTGDDGKLRFLNTETFQTEYKYDAGYGLLTISDNGEFIAFKSGFSGKSITIMNTQTKEIIGQIPGNASAVTSIAFSPDGKYLAISNQNLTTTMYQISDLKGIKQFTPGRAFIGLDISLNNQYLIGGIGAILQLFKLLTSSVSGDNEIMEFLFPNPTNNSVTITFNLLTPENLNFNLYGISGGLISNLKTDFYQPKQIDENLYLGGLVNGTYYLKIESLQFNKSFRFVINK